MKRTTVFALCAILCGGILAAENADLEWIDAAAFVEGRGFADAETYGRLPKRAWEAEGIDKVLTMGNHATGLALRFTTDSETLKFRYTLKSASKDDAWCGWAGLYGIDVYGWDAARGAWRFERVGRGKARDVNQEWVVRSKRRDAASPCEKARAWVKEYFDRMVTADGEILGYRKEDCKLDNINTGKAAFDWYELAVAEGNAEEAARMKKVLDEEFAQLKIQPRTSEGGFWHKTVYPHQMWLDGLCMAAPFYARYAAKFLEGKERDAAFADVLKQFELVATHTYDAETGLYRHGWDEAKAQIWADKTTGQSRHAWGRALGWFAAAMADTLEYIPENTKGRDALVRRFQSFVRSLEAWQDASGAWWQVADEPGREGNYREATATALIGYALLKGYNRGWLDGAARDTALRALDALNRDFLKREADGTVSLARCCAVAGLSADRDGSFEYYLREPIRDNDAKGTGRICCYAWSLTV